MLGQASSTIQESGTCSHHKKTCWWQGGMVHEPSCITMFMHNSHHPARCTARHTRHPGRDGGWVMRTSWSCLQGHQDNHATQQGCTEGSGQDPAGSIRVFLLQHLRHDTANTTTSVQSSPCRSCVPGSSNITLDRLAFPCMKVCKLRNSSRNCSVS